MNDDAVEAAVARIRARDAELGRGAAAAADQMTAGQGADVIYQAGLQDDLWWRVPKSFPAESWDGIVAGAAALFDELGLDRYAVVARSDTTAEILEGWRRSRQEGHARAMQARKASGVAAPDTQLLTWGTVFGSYEGAALELVERALETAIVDGELVPGGRGSKQGAVEIAERTLQKPLDLPPGQTPLTLVTTERVESWIAGARDAELRRLREGVANRLLNPVHAPADLDAVVAPMRWLLEHAVDGIELTQSHYLARALVVESVERFDWWDWDKPPRSESDVHQLGELREIATELRLVRRKGRLLTTTTKGAALVDDPEGLWRLLATTLGGHDDFDQVVGELVGLFLLDRPSVDGALIEFVGRQLDGLGWRVAGGEPLDDAHARMATWDRLRWWRLLGIADTSHGRWDNETRTRVEPPKEWLIDFGETTVLAYLRHRATRPRTSPYD